MIDSADEFKEWFDAPQSLERVRKFRQGASSETLIEVADRFPECRSDVAWRRDVPMALLAQLRADEDEGVQWRVRTNERWLREHPEDAEPWLDDPAAPIHLRLTEDERALLKAGLAEWAGPASCTEELAIAMGFRSTSDLFAEAGLIGDGIQAGRPQTRTDWTRALLATEIAFSSDVVGSGWDWSITTGFSDATTLAMLRGLQRKIVVGGVVGRVFGTRQERNPD